MPLPGAEAEDTRRQTEIARLFAEFAPKFPGAPEISAEELARDVRNNDRLVVVDVRTKAEQDVSVIRGAVRKDEFEASKAEFKDHKVVAYCTIGYRSGQYVETLRTQGFRAFNLKGSILSWTHVGGELQCGEGDGGEPTMRVHTFGKDWDLASSDCESVFHQKPALAYVAALVPAAFKPWTWFKKP